jgi:hypothetical protein
MKVTTTARNWPPNLINSEMVQILIRAGESLTGDIQPTLINTHATLVSFYQGTRVEKTLMQILASQLPLLHISPVSCLVQIQTTPLLTEDLPVLDVWLLHQISFLESKPQRKACYRCNNYNVGSSRIISASVCWVQPMAPLKSSCSWTWIGSGNLIKSTLHFFGKLDWYPACNLWQFSNQ